MSALAEALVAAQAELPCALGKDADGQIGTLAYRYLTLDKLIEATKPILQRHGLAIVQEPTFIERGDEAAIPALSTAEPDTGEVKDTLARMGLEATERGAAGLMFRG